MPALHVQMPDSRYDKDENWERCNIQILSAAYQKTAETPLRLIRRDCIWLTLGGIPRNAI